MKADFSFVSLNLNTIVHKKTPETCARFMDDALKTCTIKNI